MIAAITKNSAIPTIAIAAIPNMQMMVFITAIIS